MMNNIKKIEEYLDYVYKDAKNRQKDFIIKVFNVYLAIALFYLCKNYEYDNIVEILNKYIFKNTVYKFNFDNNIKYLLKSNLFSLYNFYDILFKNNSKYNLTIFIDNLNIESYMNSSMNENYNLLKIKIVDNGIKSRARSLEKIIDKFDGDFTKINDINRITIISDNINMLDDFYNLLIYIYPNNFIARNGWEMKYFGFIVKSSYLIFNNFLYEIHFNETKQFNLSSIITHKIYEIYRTENNNNNNILEVRNNIINNYLYDNNVEKILKEINDSLNQIDFKKNLLYLHRYLHKIEINKANIEWQIY